MPDIYRTELRQASRYREVELKEFRVACGEFIALSDIGRDEWERPGTAALPNGIPWAVGMYATRGRGTSMEPKIENGWWLFFHPASAGSRQHRRVLVEDMTKSGGDRYTLKKYESDKTYYIDGTWEHSRIWLLPLNNEHKPINLDKNGNYRIVGWYVGAAKEISRVERFTYTECVGE